MSNSCSRFFGILIISSLSGSACASSYQDVGAAQAFQKARVFEGHKEEELSIEVPSSNANCVDANDTHQQMCGSADEKKVPAKLSIELKVIFSLVGAYVAFWVAVIAFLTVRGWHRARQRARMGPIRYRVVLGEEVQRVVQRLEQNVSN